MTNVEAIQAFRAGKRIRLPWWPANQYVCRGNHGGVLTQDGRITSVSLGLSSDEGFVLYEEPGNDFAWAVDRLLEGHRVRRRGWHVGVSFRLDGEGWLLCRGALGESQAIVVRHDLVATDWDEEPLT
jgi:hypothetical protein